MNAKSNENTQFIYVVISKTQTKFARCIRYLGHLEYNHSALGLDADLNDFYAFSRPQHRAIFLGRLVRETLDRYTLKKNRPVPIVVFQLPVSVHQLEHLKETIQKISDDPEYMYNLFSVLFFPFTHGFATYKAYNCTEFVAHTLKELNFPLPKHAHEYRPDDFVKILQEYIIFTGDIRDYMHCKTTDEQYFEGYTPRMIYQNFVALLKIIKRTYFCKKKSNI